MGGVLGVQSLLVNGRALLDPLSLEDCAGVRVGGSQTNLITVQVQ